MLDRLEQRHRDRDLVRERRVLRRSAAGRCRRYAGTSVGVLGAGDPDRGVEHGRVERAAGERDEDPPRARPAARRGACSRCGTTSAAASSDHERGERDDERRSWRRASRGRRGSRRRGCRCRAARAPCARAASRRRSRGAGDSSGVPTKMYVEPRSAATRRTVATRSSPSSSRKCTPRTTASRRSAASCVASSSVGGRPGFRTQSASISRAEPLRRAPGAAHDPLRLRLRLDEREHALGDRLLAERLERAGDCRRASTSSATSRSASSRSADSLSARKKLFSATSARSGG